jgi:hypothetical protein
LGGCLVRSVEIGTTAGLRYARNVDKLIAAAEQVTICLAGAIAQERGCPGSRSGNDVDQQLACDAAAFIASNPSAFLHRSYRQTEKLLDQYCRHVEMLAIELLVRRRLSGAAVRALCSSP